MSSLFFLWNGLGGVVNLDLRSERHRNLINQCTSHQGNILDPFPSTSSGTRDVSFEVRLHEVSDLPNN